LTSGGIIKLPVDAYFPVTNLIVEYKEKQHFQAVKIMDKRMTISGVNRGEQRRIYDLRKEQWAVENNIRFLIIGYSDLAHKKNGRLIRSADEDKKVVKKLLNEFKVLNHGLDQSLAIILK
jgi:predicted GTPase